MCYNIVVKHIIKGGYFMSKTCGIIIGEGDLIVSARFPSEDANNIAWEKVSEEFKEEFIKTWGEAFKDAEKNNDNQGMNVLSVLDRLGYMINEGLIPKDMGYEEAYDKALSSIFDDIHSQ